MMIKEYSKMSKEELNDIIIGLKKQYDDIKNQGINLDMSRGKPSKEQLDLTMPMLDVLNGNSDIKALNGTDVRNYGVLEGLSEVKSLLADVAQVNKENVIVFGNSSLSIMFDTISRAYTHGISGNTAWGRLEKIKFLCPAPGYDRHFKISEYFGMELIYVPMTENGPDMDMVERLVKEDDAVKGIWCVPKYSNPQGYSYSDETVKRFANLKPKAKDFRIFWDNAYCVHHIKFDKKAEILNILDECENAGNPDLAYMFFSTSKISFAGSGISGIASSKDNLEQIKKHMSIQCISHDKINQLRHFRFFKDIDGINEHMKKHAEIMRPKFELVIDSFEKELKPLKIATWTDPVGGYFISFEALNGCAKKIVSMAKDAGLVLTEAGASFPYGIDPNDSNIRIAPSFPDIKELRDAVELFILCVKLVSAQMIYEER